MKLSVKFQMIAIKPKYTRICVTQKTLETKHKPLNTKHYYLKVLYHTCIAELNLEVLTLRLAANRLSSSAKTLAKSSVSSGVEFRQRTFALLVSFTFLLFLRVVVSLFYKKSPCIMLSLFSRWLQKPNLCTENDYTNILYFLCEHIFLTVFTLIT